MMLIDLSPNMNFLGLMSANIIGGVPGGGQRGPVVPWRHVLRPQNCPQVLGRGWDRPQMGLFGSKFSLVYIIQVEQRSLHPNVGLHFLKLHPKCDSK